MTVRLHEMIWQAQRDADTSVAAFLPFEITETFVRIIGSYPRGTPEERVKVEIVALPLNEADDLLNPFVQAVRRIEAAVLPADLQRAVPPMMITAPSTKPI